MFEYLNISSWIFKQGDANGLINERKIPLRLINCLFLKNWFVEGVEVLILFVLLVIDEMLMMYDTKETFTINI